MTSKLKCPVCNHKLYQTASEPSTYCCLYKDCQSDFKFAGSKELWQALIHTKKQLDRAKWWLKEIVKNHRYTPITTAEMALKELDDENNV